jgi:2-methylcitrate dehydratase PrpD
MDIMGNLVRHIVRTKYEDIPREIVDFTKKAIIDTIGVLLAGTASVEGRIITDLVQEWGGKEESTVINRGFKIPVHHAALANGTMARVVDMDDVLERASLHVHASIVSSALSVAERIGGVNGKNLLTAIILGTDLLCRLGLSNKVPTAVSGMNSSYQYGTFGVAATSGRLLGLNEDKLWNAMGIAYSLTSGNSQCLTEGAMTTRLGQGTCAQSGVLSTFLAQKGFTGVKNVLQGKFGYFNCYQRGEYYPQALTDALGKRFEGLDLTFKQYSCCLHTHAAIEGTLNLIEKHHLKPDDIREIHVGVNQQAYNLVVEPVDVKYDPHEIAAAQFSIPFTQGTAVLKKKAFIDDFTEKEIRNPKVLEIAKRVRASIDPEIEKTSSGRVTPAKVKIVTHKSQEFTEKVEFIKGHPNNPLSFDELINKFRMCNSFAKKPLSNGSIEAFVDLIQNLESLGDITRIIKFLG